VGRFEKARSHQLDAACVEGLYAEVPVCVKTADGFSSVFEATSGVKQGCPLSPLLFGMYVDDLEGEVMATHARGEQLDLPRTPLCLQSCMLMISQRSLPRRKGSSV